MVPLPPALSLGSLAMITAWWWNFLAPGCKGQPGIPQGMRKGGPGFPVSSGLKAPAADVEETYGTQAQTG